MGSHGISPFHFHYGPGKLEQVQDFHLHADDCKLPLYIIPVYILIYPEASLYRQIQNEKQQHLFFFWHKQRTTKTSGKTGESIGREDLIEKLIEEKKKHHKQEFIKRIKP